MQQNIILIDCQYADKVADNLRTNFAQMLSRDIPRADIAHWIDCLALDGGITQGGNQVQVLFLYDKKREQMRNFTPSDINKELKDKAFKDNLGEFAMEAYPVENGMTTMDDFLCDMLKVIVDDKDTKRIMVVADMETYAEKVIDTLKDNENKLVKVFAMSMHEGKGFTSEVLGYSLMSALGIRGEEV